MIDSNFPEKVRTALTDNYSRVDENETEVISYNLNDDFHDEFLSGYIANNLIVDLGLETEPSEDIVVRTTETAQPICQRPLTISQICLLKTRARTVKSLSSFA